MQIALASMSVCDLEGVPWRVKDARATLRFLVKENFCHRYMTVGHFLNHYSI